MTKYVFSKKSVKCATITICLLALLISLFSLVSFSDGGFRTFTSADQSDPLFIKKHFEELPMAYSATISVPSNLSQYCPIISNYPNVTNYYFGFNIERDGRPAISYNNKSAKTSAAFSYDLRGKGEVNVTVVCETDTGSAVYKLYIDGVLQDSLTITSYPTIHNIDPLNSQSSVREVSIGTDGRAQSYTSTVAIKDIFVYSKAPSYTAEGGLSFADGSLMASYENMNEHADFIRDTSGNGHDAVRNSFLTGYTGGSALFTESDQKDPLYIKKHFDVLPRAYSTTVSVPASLSAYSPIITNYSGVKEQYYFGMEIGSDGKPTIYYNSHDYANRAIVKFDYSLKGMSDVNVTLACEINNDSSVYKLYINGVYQESKTVTKAAIHDFDAIVSQTENRELSIGADGNVHTKIAIKDLSIYSTAPSYTSEGGLSFAEGSLMASYENMASCLDVIPDTSGNGHDAMRNSYYIKTVEGMSFSENNVSNPLVINNYLTKIPRAIEAEIFMPSGISSTSPIFGSYNNGSGTYMGLEINASGNPVFYYRTYTNKNDQIRTSITFSSYDVRGKGYIKLAVTNEIDSGESVYKLYVNGVLTETHVPVVHTDTKYSDTYIHNFDVVRAQRVTKEFTVGCDGLNFFKGKMKSVAIYDTALTEEEILISFENGVDLGGNALIAYYDLTSEDNNDELIKDESGNGHDLTPNFYERENELNEYAYSFAFLGDTQFLIDADINKGGGTKYATPIYDWLLANKDSKKIEYVFGLGDVTETNADAEWAYAKSLYQKLSGNIPYAVISGNHDTVPKLDKYFANETSLTDNITGYYKEGSVGNYYMNFEVLGNKYTVLTLEYGANDDILTWANSVVGSEELKDRQVIILTHCYMDYDGELTYAGGTGGLTTNANTGYVYNNGQDMWDEFISLHENVVMVVAGHIDPLVIQRRHDDKGVNGNTVHQFLIDPQAIDHAHANETGMIAMFYFSADGSEVQVEYISAYKSLERGEDVLFREENQFSFTIDEVGSERTPYGVIPADMVSDDKPVALFRNGKCIGTYSLFSHSNGYGSALEAAKNQLSGGNYASEEDGTVYIYFRSDAAASNRYENFGQIVGKVVIDLNGKTLTQNYAGNTLFYTMMKYLNNSMGDLTVEVKNGDIVLERSLMTFDGNDSYTNAATDERYKTVNFTYKNVDFSVKAGKSSYSENFLGYFDVYGKAAKLLKYNVVFNDCNFDLTGFVAKSTSVFMNANDPDTSKTNVVVNVTVNGGSLMLADSSLKLSDSISNGSSVTFGKGSDGKYMTLIAPTVPALSNSVYINGDAESVFVAYKTDGGNVFCSLTPKAVLGFTPKTSITLGSELVYNIYVPVEDYLKSFTVNGATYENAEVVTLEDGKEYYLISVPMPASEAAKDIVLKATITVDGKDYSGTWTMSIPKYATKVLSSDATETEKTLVKDVLAYINSAYLYFNKTTVSAIDEILGTYKGTLDTTTPETNATVGLKGATLVLEATPALRFYLADDADKNAYTFYVNGGKVAAKEGTDKTGTYLEVSLYAYKMCETVTYKINGVESGSYHIGEYYEYAKTLENANLTALVENFWIYCQSAKAYKASVAV